MLFELGMPSISSVFPRIQDVFDQEVRVLDRAFERGFDRFTSELEWYATALRDGREKDVPY